MRLNSGVYEIVNLSNGKRYIGSTANLRVRKHMHFSELKYQRHHSAYLQSSYDKHGVACFQFRILIYCNHASCLYYEQALLDLIAPEYNISPSATSPFGIRRSEATKAKLRAYGARPEVRKKRREVMIDNQYGLSNRSRTGQKSSKAICEKHSLAMRGINNPNAILNEQKILLIRYLVSKGISRGALARGLGMCFATMSFAVSGHTWSHISYRLRGND